MSSCKPVGAIMKTANRNFKSSTIMIIATIVKWLFIPTIINLFLTYFILKVYFKGELSKVHYNQSGNGEKVMDNGTNDEQLLLTNVITNPRLAKISIIILLFTIAGFVISEALQFLYHVVYFSISVIAVLGATALYAFSRERRELLYKVNYSVLIFFAAMFVFTSALWTSGLIPEILMHIPNPVANNNNNNDNVIKNNAIISVVSVTLSQILSNVPFVALYNNVMINNGLNANDVSEWMMLAAASTIAGNLTIFGAASNIIIIEAAESRGVKTFSFIEFLKIGSVVTASNIIIHYVFTTLLFG